MGGLVARAAITGLRFYGVEGGSPPYFYVEDVVTLGTPHEGALISLICITSKQPLSLLPTQYHEVSREWSLPRLSSNPQFTFRTKWTVIGAEDDLVVQPKSTSLGILPFFDKMFAGHLVMYDAGNLESTEAVSR